MFATRLGLGSTSSFQFSTRNFFNTARNCQPSRRFASFNSKVATIQKTTSNANQRSSNVLTGGLITSVGLGLFSWNSRNNTVHCEPAVEATNSPIGGRSYAAAGSGSDPAGPPQSTVNAYQLSFGTVCGICAGVFIKKGAKFIAFLLGGAFIFLQYFSSQRLITVNWSALSKRYDSMVDSAAGSGGKVSGYNGSTAQRIWNRGTHFLMADFQPRATFMAGLLLGLRIG